MRHFVLMRHGHALEPCLGQRDYQRVLSDSGCYRVGVQAMRFRECVGSDFRFDLAWISDAARTRQTFDVFCADFAVGSCVFDPALYDATCKDVWLSLARYYTHESVLLVGHNPWAADFAQRIFSLRGESGVCSVVHGGQSSRVHGERIPLSFGFAPAQMLWLKGEARDTFADFVKFADLTMFLSE